MKQLLVTIDETLEGNLEARISQNLFECFEFSHSTCSVLEILKQPKAFISVRVERSISSPGILKMSRNLAATLELDDGGEIYVKKMPFAPSASLVVVSAVTIDDYEIIEKNQRSIEEVFLRQTRVVFAGMRIPIRLSENCSVNLLVKRISGRVNGDSECYELVDGTELAIKTQCRTVATKKLPAPGILCNIVYMNCECGTEKLQKCLEYVQRVSEGIVFVSSKVAEAHGWSDKDDIYAIRVCEVAREAFQLKGDALSSFINAKNGLSANPAVIRASKKLQICVCTDDCCLRVDCKVKKFLGGIGVISFVFSPGELLYFFSVEGKTENCAVKYERKERELTSTTKLEHPSLHLLDIGNLVHTWQKDHTIYRNYLIESSQGMGKTTYLRYISQKIPSVFVDGRILSYLPLNERITSLKEAFTACTLLPSVLLIDNLDAIFTTSVPAEERNMNDPKIVEIGHCLRLLLELQQRDNTFQVIATLTANTQWAPDVLKRYFETSFASKLRFQSLSPSKAYEFFVATLDCSAFDSKKMIDTVTVFLASFTPQDIQDFAQKVGHLIRYGSFSPEDAFNTVRRTFQPTAYEESKHIPSSSANESVNDAVYAMDGVKKKLNDVILKPIKNSEMFAKLPVKLSRGILLYGPTGSGKTHLINTFLKVNGLRYVKLNGPEVMQKYVGSSEAKVREIFLRAQQIAPCVIYIDEIDACVPQRGSDSMGITDRIVNQFLCEMDGVESLRSVYIIAASSRPEVIDKALLRPGRLDTHVFCGLPSFHERVSVIQKLSEIIKFSLDERECHDLAERMDDWSYADIKSAFDRAVEVCMSKTVDLREALGSSTKTLPLEQESLNYEYATKGNLQPHEAESLLEKISLGDFRQASRSGVSSRAPCSVSLLKDIVSNQRSSVTAEEIRRLRMFQRTKRNMIVGQLTATV